MKTSGRRSLLALNGRKYMSKHTPGPWYVGGPTEYCFQLAIEPSIGAAYGGGEEVQANARLIAAAPEMLAALDYALAVADEGLRLGPEWRKKTRAVIVKAKGETE